MGMEKSDLHSLRFPVSCGVNASAISGESELWGTILTDT
jgi:hypothetical protein